jgi:uracil-DNA glycosylase family 4
MADLYRIPVDEPNYSQVLETPVDPGQCDHIPTALRERGPIRLWAVRPGERNERLYEGLSRTDGLLFYRGAKHDDANESRYVAVGRVGEKALLDEAGATELFRTPAARRAYVVEDLTFGPWSRETVESLLGYSGYPQGPQRVQDDRYGAVSDVFSELTDSDDEQNRNGPASPFDEIVRNALNGHRECDGCPAHQAGNCKRVNPGLGDDDADIAFVTEEPKHFVDWDAHDDWAAWNEQFMQTFPNADGGQYIQSLLDPLGVSIHEVWVADSLKCPTIDHDGIGTTAVPAEEAFEHCRPYLKWELRNVGPEIVVTLGNPASQRTLSVLGRSERIRSKSDAGRVFETEPTVVVSPHWGAYSYTSNAEEAQLTDAVRESLARIYD